MRPWMILVFALAFAVPAFADDLDADALWKALQAGNLKYAAGEVVYPDLVAERKALLDKQLPPVTVLACSDSRVPPELLFNQSLGALFVVRSAGDVTDDLGLASIEYAIKMGWTKLIVVLGHENCGAVDAALQVADPITPSLQSLVNRIRTSFTGIAWTANNKAPVLEQATNANTRASAAWLTAHSAVIRTAVVEGKVKMITAYYSMKTGEVTGIE